MSNFSPSDAALEGFRLTREQPTTILAWAGVYFAGIMILAAIMVIGIGREFIEFIRNGGLQSGDTEALGALLASSAPAFILALTAAIFLFSVLTAGIYRLVLRPTESGFAHLRLGGDEIRVALVNLMLISIGMGFLVALELIIQAGSNMEGGGAVIASLAGLGVLALFIWIGVRLSLATPLAFAERKISLRAAWRLSQGKFWRLFGMIVMAVIFYVIVWVLVSIIAVLFITFAGGAGVVQNLGNNPSPFAIAAFLVSFVIQLLLPILQAVMIYSPLALAYQQLTAVEASPDAPLPDPI
jgi:hypothetical protein